MSAYEVEREKQYTNVSVPFPKAWSGTCAPYDDIDALVDVYEGQGLGVNLFFKSPQEPDWRKSRYDRYADQPADNSMKNGWTMHEYQKLSSTSHVECDLYLKHTSAYVNRPRSFGFEENFFKPYKSWFDFDRSDCSRSYADDTRFDEYSTPYRWDLSGHSMGENRTRFFDISVRMNHKRRKIEVRRQNYREMLSDIGGSWEPSLFLGWLIIVVINRTFMAASACARSCEGAVAPKVAPANAPAPAAEVAEAPAPAAEAPVSPAAKRWKFLAMNWKSLKRQMQSANYFQLLNSAPPEAPAPPPLDPRKFAELLERVRKLEEQVRNS